MDLQAYPRAVWSLMKRYGVKQSPPKAKVRGSNLFGRAILSMS